MFAASTYEEIRAQGGDFRQARHDMDQARDRVRGAADDLARTVSDELALL
jgi:hypothetical protein